MEESQEPDTRLFTVFINESAGQEPALGSARLRHALDELETATSAIEDWLNDADE